MRITRDDKLYVLLLFAVALLIFFLNACMQWYGDALLYKFSFDDGRPIESLSDIISSQIVHYQVMNGRVWAHVLCQLFSGILGQKVFALCNAVVYVLFIIIFIKYSCPGARDMSVRVWGVLLVLFFCDTSYTPNCQIGYIWTSMMCVAYLYMLRRMANTQVRPTWLIVMLLMLLSLIAGSGNEAICLGIAGALCFELIWSWRRLTVMQKAMIVAFGCGAIVLCLCPANFHRHEIGYKQPMLWRLYYLAADLRVFYLLLIVLVVSLLKRRVNLREMYVDNRIIINAIILLLIFNLIIGVKNNRQVFGIELFSSILILKLLSKYDVKPLLTAVFAIFVGAIYMLKMSIILDFKSDVQRLRTLLQTQPRGSVYIDLPLYNSLVNPTEYMSYKDQVNMFYHVAALIDDIDGTGRFYERDRVPNAMDTYAGVHLYPEVMGQVKDQEVKNQYFEKDGVYLLLRDKKNPATFILNRQYNIFGITMPMAQYEVPFNNEYNLDTEDYEVVVTSFPVPFMEPLDIEIVNVQ